MESRFQLTDPRLYASLLTPIKRKNPETKQKQNSHDTGVSVFQKSNFVQIFVQGND